MDSTKRKQYDAGSSLSERESSAERAKRRCERIKLQHSRYPPFFAIVWHRDWDGVSPVCFASSHWDAQRKVDALRAELDAYVSAGGDFRGEERTIRYGYATTDGDCWRSKPDGEKTPDSESDEGSARRAAKVSIEDLLYHRGDRRPLMGDDDSASMEFAANQGVSRTRKRFWDNVKNLSYGTIQTLRSIYAVAGSYRAIPGDSGDEKEEESESSE